MLKQKNGGGGGGKRNISPNWKLELQRDALFFLTAIPKNLLFLKRKHYKEVFLLHFWEHKLLSPVF